MLFRSEEVRKYVSDFLLLQQQDLHQRQPPTAPQVPPDQENHLAQPDQVSPIVEQQGLLHLSSAGQVPLPSLSLRGEPSSLPGAQMPFPSLALTLAAPEPVLVHENVLSQPVGDVQVSAADSNNSVAEQGPAADSHSDGDGK